MSLPPTNPITSCQLIREEKKTPATADTNQAHSTRKQQNHHQIHNTPPTNVSFQRFTITKNKIKHPCTNKKKPCCVVGLYTSQRSKMRIELEARGCREDTNERSAQICNNQINEERNIVLRFKPYSLLASLITRTINKVAFDGRVK